MAVQDPHDAPFELERQELRIALVMNGGVSLAVWMGGVTLELDRARRAEGVYGELLELTATDARIDVIAGASAGGINGAVLALAIGRGKTVDGIRAMWIEDGDVDALLRDPLRRDAQSVLKGDGQLLVKLDRAMREIGGGIGPNPARAESDQPLHLSITTTTLSGITTTYPDRFGATIPDVTHQALFSFSREAAVGAGEHRDDFAAPGDGQDDLLPARLALAARSSASFPGAFEPSFVPIGESRDSLHPDMKEFIELRSSGLVIDGGVLVNTPFRPALDAIKALPADLPVRRVLGYVVPNPGGSPAPSDCVDVGRDGVGVATGAPVRPSAANGGSDTRQPTATEVVFDAVSRLPRVQSVGRELAEIVDNNRNVRRRRDARDEALSRLTADGLETAALLLLPVYEGTRRAAAADDIEQALIAGKGSDMRPSADELARLRSALRGLEDPPWLPPRRDYQTFADVPIDPWPWGLAPLDSAANVALEALQRTARAGLGDGTIDALRTQSHEALATLRAMALEIDEYWRAHAAVLLDGRRSLLDLTGEWQDLAQRLTPATRTIAGVIVQLAEALPAISEDESREARRVRRTITALAAPSVEQTIRRLLALDVVQRASGADLSGIEQEVELVLMSADVFNAFGTQRFADEKLAGLQVGHFGAFYKSSWRANDWMWGRLDSADRLVRTLLEPRRVKERVRGDGLDATTATIRALACNAGTPQASEWLARAWEQESREQLVRKELFDLQSQEDPPATALGEGYAAIRRRVQLEILLEEIPQLAAAVVADRDAHAAPDSRGSVWQRGLPADRPLTVQETIEAFKSCPVGEERILAEVGSDRFTRVSTKGAAVLGSVLGGTLPRPRALQPALAMIRGLLLTLYLLGRGVTESSRTGAFLVALALALGGALVAVYAIGTQVPGVLLLLGSTILIGGVLLAILRKTFAQLAFALVLLLGTAAAFYGLRSWHARPGWVEPLSAMLAVALMAFAATALGWTGPRDTRAAARVRRRR